jgi:hypothetical protein
MSSQFDQIKTSLIIYSIIIAIILIQKPKVFFNNRMELKILVLTKDRKYTVPLLYVFIILMAILSYFIPKI